MLSAPVPPPARLHALDGLRGVAALVVLLYHASKIMQPELGPRGGLVFTVIADSPAKLMFAGTEAVLVFFALSGLVVALPAFRPGFSWRSYLGSRLVRLYLPVWAALLLASVLVLLFPREAGVVTTGSWLDTSSAREVSPAALLGEATLLQRSYQIDNVLWSLRWEVLFSVLLPVFVGIALVLRRVMWPAVLVALALSVAGRLLGVEALVYLPVFCAGTLLASRIDDVRAWGARRSRAFWTAFGTASAGLLVAGWLLRPVVDPNSPSGEGLWGVAGAGAVGLVITAVGSRGAARALEARPAAWLGRVSFSLYLVHVPVLATLAYLWGEAAWPTVLAVGIPASLASAEVFTRLVERPSHRLAQAVRRAIARGAAPRLATLEPTER